MIEANILLYFQAALFLFILVFLEFMVIKWTDWRRLGNNSEILAYLAAGIWSNRVLRKYIPEKKIKTIIGLKRLMLLVLFSYVILIFTLSYIDWFFDSFAYR